MATTTFDPSEGPTAEQQAAEASALEQGEKLTSMQQEDRDRKFQQVDDENQQPDLIGGKFKSQEDLLKAYNELQRKLGNPEETSEQTEATEVEQPEQPQEVEPEVAETVNYMHQLNQEFGTSGELSEEAVERLGSMDSKELIKAYMAYNAQSQNASLQQSELNAIQQSVGGPEVYTEMVQWAAANLPEDEIADFNAVTATNNPAAIKFAVQSLANRYRDKEGFEAPLVSGRKAPSKDKAFRSHAELSRAIADPRYSTDPAYRRDVEEKLSRSGDLL